MCSGKKYLLEIQPTIFHKMGSAHIHIGLMNTMGKITYNRGIFRIKKDSSHSMGACSTQSLIQPFYPVYSHGASRAWPWEADWGWRTDSGFLQRRLSDKETWCMQSSCWSKEGKKDYAPLL